MKSNMKCLTKNTKNWKKCLKQRKNNRGDMKQLGSGGRNCISYTTEIDTFFDAYYFSFSWAKIKWCWPGAWRYVEGPKKYTECHLGSYLS